MRIPSTRNCASRGIRTFLGLPFLLVALAMPPLGAQQEPKSSYTGSSWCPLHRYKYTGMECPKCNADRSRNPGGSSSSSSADVAGGFISAVIADMFRGDPGRAARLEAEARELALARERAAVELARKKTADFNRLLRELKLHDFDAMDGPKLKGVDGEAGGGLELKLGDDGLKPLGTRASRNDRDTGVNTDPMVVDLRSFQRAAYVATQPGTNEDMIVAVAQGGVTISMPATYAPPTLPEGGLKQFQEANNAYRRSHDDGQKEAEYFNRVQLQRDIAGQELRKMRLDLERQLAAETDKAELEKKHQLMAKIFATARAEQEAWMTAKAELDARRAREAFDRAKLIVTVNALRTGASAPAAAEPEDVKTARFIKAMNALTAKMGWSPDEQDRVKKAFDGLRQYVPADEEVIQKAWKEVLSDGRGSELAAKAAQGEGPGLPGAGTQTVHQDCAIFALATAAGLPYGVVGARATMLIRQGEWREPAERVNAQAAIEKKGVYGGEVVLLAESFGQAEVIDRSDFVRTLREGRPVMVDVVPPSGNLQAGHEVVLTRTFEHQGTTWYEMIDSNQGPVRRLYLSEKELQFMLKESGVAFRPDPGTVPMLLRNADGK